MVITDPATGDRVIWRGGNRIRAYDRRARLISSIEIDENEATDDVAREARMQVVARLLRLRRAKGRQVAAR